MIKTIKRIEILKTYSSAREEIIQLQKDQYDPDQLLFLTSENEKLYYLKMFDALVYPSTTIIKYYKVLSLHHLELETYPRALADKVASLLLRLKIDKLVILSHLKTKFFNDLHNSYQPLRESYHKLLQLTESDTYDEGFEIDLEDLPLVFEIFFWILRCDTKAPEYILFFDTRNRLGFFICQYGNVHTIEFEKEILTHDLLLSYSLEEINSRCYEKFTADAKIQGRK